MKKRKNILILQGGKNEEHEISLVTAKEVNKALTKLGYKTSFLNVDPKTFEEDIKFYKPDCCFNALHGTFGEDGQIQRILFNRKIPFTHSGIQASSIAFNKHKTKLKLRNTKVKLLCSKLTNSSQINEKLLIEIFEKIGPLVIKPTSSGSSYGIKIIKTQKDIKNFFLFNYKNKLYKKHKNLLIEPFVKGKELTVSIIEKNNISKPVEVTEIIYKSKYFDYKSKYKDGLSKHIIPANLPIKIYNKCLKFSKIVHDKLGCRGISRSDFIFNENKQALYFLEINTQPGLTPISLIPEQLAHKGISFLEMIDLLVKISKWRN